MRFYIQSLGCPKNLVDSEEVTAAFFDRGDELTYEEDQADVLILNTCSFIDAARQESFSQIERLITFKSRGKKLFVMGCLPQMVREELFEKYPQIDAIMGVNNVRDGINELLSGQQSFFSSGSWKNNNSRAILTLEHSVYLKIAEGCDHKCAFCTIPAIRGKYRSRPLEDIVREAEFLAQNGTKELNLIAQDSTAYGLDLYAKARLTDLLSELDRLGVWVRIMYMYPSMISDQLLETMAGSENILPYFDIPFQHYSEKILQLMNRPVVDLDGLVSRIRKLPESAIRATFISGYPGENEADHHQLKDFVQRSEFDRMALFAYSAEDGTAAARLPAKVDPVIVEQRIDDLYELQSRIIDRKNERLIDTVQTVLFDNQYQGRTYRDAPDIDGLFELETDEAQPGEFARVVVKQAQGYNYFGDLLK